MYEYISYGIAKTKITTTTTIYNAYIHTRVYTVYTYINITFTIYYSILACDVSYIYMIQKIPVLHKWRVFGYSCCCYARTNKNNNNNKYQVKNKMSLIYECEKITTTTSTKKAKRIIQVVYLLEKYDTIHVWIRLYHIYHAIDIQLVSFRTLLIFLLKNILKG